MFDICTETKGSNLFGEGKGSLALPVASVRFQHKLTVNEDVVLWASTNLTA